MQQTSVMVSDRRRSPRISVDLPAKVASDHVAQVKDLSESGVLLETSVDLAIGEFVDLEIELHRDGRWLALKGQAVVKRVDTKGAVPKLGLHIIDCSMHELSRQI